MMKFICFISLTFFSVAAFGQSKFNKSLVALLDTIYNEDQNDRLKSDSLQKIYGWKSKQMEALWNQINYKDSINLIKIKNIINDYGWLGPEEVGKKGAQAIFLVIQHADSSTQVTYLPILRQAVKERKARPQDLAMLEDRVLMKQGKPQIYGSQVVINQITGKYEFYPIEDEANVDKRRKSIGLEPLEAYAKYFDINYTLPKTK